MSNSVDALNPVGDVSERDLIKEMEALNLDDKSSKKDDKYFHGDQNFALHAIDLMFRAEDLHNNRLADLDKQHTSLSEKLSAVKDHLQKAYKHIRSGSKDSLNLEEVKEQVISLWEEWKEELKNSDLEEYHNLKTDLNELDFSELSLEKLEEKLIPELEKIQRHHEFKFQQIPSKLRMYLELFSILVEILKEIPKKQDEVQGHMNRNAVRGG